jgi:transcriptional regulator with XRE-family HTH domain
MTGTALKSARKAKGLSQVQAAAGLGVSQPYVAMLEAGKRRLTPDLLRRAMALYGLSPSVLSPRDHVSRDAAPDTLAQDLAALGYPGFSYLRPKHWTPKNPGEVLMAALAKDDLEPRVVEALPWLVFVYADLDWRWAAREAKLHDLQNRLGFVVSLARALAVRAGDLRKAERLGHVEHELERSRLAHEDTLGRASLPEPERRWVAEHRSEEAKRWNVLTDWTLDALRYAS